MATRSNTSNSFYSVESTTMVHKDEQNDGKNEGLIILIYIAKIDNES